MKNKFLFQSVLIATNCVWTVLKGFFWGGEEKEGGDVKWLAKFVKRIPHRLVLGPIIFSFLVMIRQKKKKKTVDDDTGHLQMYAR